MMIYLQEFQFYECNLQFYRALQYSHYMLHKGTIKCRKTTTDNFHQEFGATGILYNQ